MNNIAERQNEPEMLRMLAAQRQLYLEEKQWIWRWLLITTLIAVISSSVLAAIDLISAYITVMLILVAVGELVVYSNLQKRGENAAHIQEMFDTTLFNLPWNTAVKKPPKALINAAAERYDNSTSAEEKAKYPLTNWYGYELKPEMPLYQARVACQKENVNWEDRIRRTYIRWVIRALLGLGLLVMLVGIALNWTFQEFFAKTLILLLPIFLAGGNHVWNHHKALKSIEDASKTCENLWEYVQSPTADPEEATRRSYDLQQEIRHYRATNPPVFDWLYRRIKKQIDKEIALGQA